MPIKNILIVDDSPTDRQFLSDLLSKNGFKVSTAKKTPTTRSPRRALKPDLVLMDVVMPGQSGFQATRALSKDEATKAIPVIICTSKSQETDKQWGMKQGARDYVVKPVKVPSCSPRSRRSASTRWKTPRPYVHAAALAARLPARAGGAAASGRQHALGVEARGAGRPGNVAGRSGRGRRGHSGAADHRGAAHSPWFQGVANVRGNLYSVVDFAAFVGVGTATERARLVLFGERLRSAAALLVDRSLGLRNQRNCARAPPAKGSRLGARRI